MTDLRHYTRYGEYKVGVHHKYYEVTAAENEDGSASWEFKWGRIGGRGQTKSGTLYSFERAREVCSAQFDHKKDKGYQEVNPLLALASAAQDPAEREDSNGLPPVDIEIPKFHADKSEPRCRSFAEKYLRKLNTIRGSRWDMGRSAYTKQIEAMLKQYCAEWKRIKASKAHAENLSHGHADTAFRIFFNDLKDNIGNANVGGYFEGVGVL